MISCTEFIPLYSEFFKYLEARDGEEAVQKYWIHISDTSIGDKTNPNSLASKCELYGGFGGAKAYWGHTLTEEACDFIKLYDYERNFIFSHMRHCPSRGMLNDFEHVEPYHNYCEHCNVIYSRVLEKYGIEYIRDNSKTENAECRSILYEKGKKPDFDWKNIADEELHALANGDTVQVVDLKTEDNKYLHRDFHLLGDNALKYCGDTYGAGAVKDFLSCYVKNYYSPIIKNIRENGLKALKAWIEKIYEIEESSELCHTELKDNSLTVTIDKSPVIEYMHSLNQEPTEYYIEETKTLYAVIADECNMSFSLEYYNEDGGTKFVFENK
ncbi:MAG: hypothetical protein II998_10835 [Clostridia bacterium]|nr:hypothetical protein [Clostridia bacterium]